jgi:peptidoglycan/LPS O-acetylase OafA/YrhL
LSYPIISSLGMFVLLFMIISAFSMCCGYYDRIKNNLISPKAFYGR